MDGLRGRILRGLNARTYILAAVLLLTVLWAASSGRPRRTARPAAQAAIAGVTAAPGAAVPAVAARSAGRRPIEQGWGPDPFARRFPGGN
jgi:hypothetical protein